MPNTANAVWYLSEGGADNIFMGVCSIVSALPGIGDAIGIASKFSGAGCLIQKLLHITGDCGGIIISSMMLDESLQNIWNSAANGEAVSFTDVLSASLSTYALVGHTSSLIDSVSTAYCFVAGTLVTTADGFKPIEEIQVGDRVLSEDETTGEVAVKTVTETYVNETDELVHIGVNGETISATPSHPFYVYKFGWTLAGSLKAGDVLVLSNGELVTVEWVQHEILESPIKVYNFEVEDFHTYFVGENGVFVHNKCGKWEEVNESMSENSRAYQEKITGESGKAWVQNGVKFDGYRDGTLIEAKGNYDNFVNKDGGFYSWFKGKDSLLDQASRQTIAAEGAAIEWYVQSEKSYNAISNLLPDYTNITVIFKP